MLYVFEGLLMTRHLSLNVKCYTSKTGFRVWSSNLRVIHKLCTQTKLEKQELKISKTSELVLSFLKVHCIDKFKAIYWCFSMYANPHPMKVYKARHSTEINVTIYPVYV